MKNPIPQARTIQKEVTAGHVSAVEICKEYLSKIDSLNPDLNAFNTIATEHALAAAKNIDLKRNSGKFLGPLAGVPIAVKDNLCVRGLRTTASSKALSHYIPPYSATVIEQLEAAGAVIIGKTNCDEFAMGSSNENSAFGAVMNPWDTTRTPGGSSGGSAVAVAANLVPVALGSDTGGSIRQPAALCGVVGLKPTYGRVSRYGLLAFASSLDQIGPMARSVADVALVLSVIAGSDSQDSTTSSEPVPDFLSELTRNVKGIRIGIPRAFIDSGINEEVGKAFELALNTLQNEGAILVEIDLPHARYAIPAYYLVATAEASSNLARYDGVRYGHRASTKTMKTLKEMYESTRNEGFGAEVKRRIMLGTYVLSAGYYDAYYRKAQQVRTLLRQDYEKTFQSVDVVAMPTTPTPAFPLGSKIDDPLQMYLGDIFTVSANLVGLPAISIPCGFVKVTQSNDAPKTLPIGLQLTGRMFDEATILRVADAYEQLTPWAQKTPDTVAI